MLHNLVITLFEYIHNHITISKLYAIWMGIFLKVGCLKKSSQGMQYKHVSHIYMHIGMQYALNTLIKIL